MEESFSVTVVEVVAFMARFFARRYGFLHWSTHGHTPRLVPLQQRRNRLHRTRRPWQNPFVESFNGHLRRELLEMESFNSLYEAQLLLEDWRLEYNHYRPHQSLSYQTPAE